MATYEDKMGDLSSLSDEDLSSLEEEIRSAFEQADQNDDLDSMSAAADALDAVRAEVESRGGEEITETEDNPTEEMTEENPVMAAAEEDPMESTPETPAEGTEAPEENAPVEAPVEENDQQDGEDETVTASANPNEAPEEAAVEIPEDRKPVPSTPLVAVTAGADVPGKSAGTPFTSVEEVSQAFTQRLGTLRGVRGGDGEQMIVATITASADDDRLLLAGDLEGNAAKIRKVTGMDTIVAAGGYCAPLEVRYDLFGLGVADRPVRDALAGFQAERGGIRYVTPPKLGDLAGAVGLWTSSVDGSPVAVVNNKALTSNVATLTTAAAHGFAVGQTVTVAIADPVFDGTYVIASVPSSTTFTYNRTNANVASAAVSPTGTATANKPCLAVACGAEQTALADAVTLCLKFGNLQSRAFPELVTRNNELGMIQHARYAEQTLLSKISALSTAVTSAHVLGTARDFLEAVARAATAYRTRHRMNRTDPLRVIAPSWVLDAMREDLTMGLPGDNLEWADAQINAFFNSRNINVSWHIDDTNFTGAQSAGALNAWPSTFKWNIYAEGTFLFLDGGTLDLGIVRDSTLLSTNDYKMFVETFEGVAKVGIEGIEVTTTTHVRGGTSAGVAVA